MDNYKQILGQHFNLKTSYEKGSKKHKDFIVQAINLYVAFCIQNGLEDIREIYKEFPYADMVSGIDEFIAMLNKTDITIGGNIASANCRWYSDYVSEYIPSSKTEKTIIDNRLKASVPLRTVGKLCNLTPEAVRQKEHTIQQKIFNTNLARTEFPHLFFKDFQHMELFKQFSFPYELLSYLESRSPFFSSAKRYYKFVSGRNIITSSSWVLNEEYVDVFIACMKHFKALDLYFDYSTYKIYKTSNPFDGDEHYVSLTGQNIIVDLLKCHDTPIAMQSLYFDYIDKIETLNLNASFDRPLSYFKWNVSLIKNVLRTSDKKIRYYDYKKYESKFNGLFSYLENLFRKEYGKFGAKFSIRDVWNAKLAERLLDVDIHNEEELHSLLKHFYRNGKITLGRIPMIKGVK